MNKFTKILPLLAIVAGFLCHLLGVTWTSEDNAVLLHSLGLILEGTGGVWGLIALKKGTGEPKREPAVDWYPGPGVPVYFPANEQPQATTSELNDSEVLSQADRVLRLIVMVAITSTMLLLVAGCSGSSSPFYRVMKVQVPPVTRMLISYTEVDPELDADMRKAVRDQVADLDMAIANEGKKEKHQAQTTRPTP